MRGGALHALSQVAVAARGFVVLALVLPHLGDSEFGVFNQAVTTATLIVPIATLRFATAAVREFAKLDRRMLYAQFLESLWPVIALAGFVGGVLLIADVPFAALVFGDGDRADLVTDMVALIAATALANSVLAAFRASRENGRFAAFTIAGAVAEVAVLGMLVASDAETSSLIVSIAAVRLSVACAVIAVLVAVGRSQLGRPRWQPTRRILNVGLTLLPNAALYWVINSSDRIFIVQLLGVENIAAYAVAQSFARLIGLVTGTISFIALPEFAEAWDAGRREEVAGRFQLVVRAYLVIGTALAVGVALVAPHAADLLLPDAGEVSVALVFWLAAVAVSSGLFQLFVHAFHLMRHTGRIPVVLSGAAVANVALNLVLIPLVDLVGAAIATTSAYAVAVYVARRWLPEEFGGSLGERAAVLWIAVAIATAHIGDVVPDSVPMTVAMSASYLIAAAGMLRTLPSLGGGLESLVGQIRTRLAPSSVD